MFDMKILTAGLPVAVFAGLMAGSVHAAPLFATVNTPGNSSATDETAYNGDVSTTDLLAGIAGTGGDWLDNGSSPDGLNDGVAGGDFNVDGLGALVGKSWSSDGDGVSFREFVLGGGANGLGYDITEIQTIASWANAGFANQKYDVSVRFLGDASFTLLLDDVEYQPFTSALNDTGGVATRINITDDTGKLASGVEAIRFDILDTTSDNLGGTVFSEIDVFGTSTVPEPGSLALLGLAGVLIARGRRG